MTSPIPGYISGMPFSSAYAPYQCMRFGFTSCYHFLSRKESCHRNDGPALADNDFFCTNIMPDAIHRYSMLGGGIAGPPSCPKPFIREIGKVGETLTLTYDGSAVGSCANMVRVKCGSPWMRVKSTSEKPSAFDVYYLEYDVSLLQSATGVFAGTGEYRSRGGQSYEAGMARNDQ